MNDGDLNYKETLERFCELSFNVAEKKFGFHEVAADCFCGRKLINNNFRFTEKVIKFIEDAVNEKLEKEIEKIKGDEK